MQGPVQAKDVTACTSSMKSLAMIVGIRKPTCRNKVNLVASPLPLVPTSGFQLQARLPMRVQFKLVLLMLRAPRRKAGPRTFEWQDVVDHALADRILQAGS